MIQKVYLPRRKDRKSPNSHPEYFGRYKLRGMTKAKQVPLHTTDKRIAENKLQAIVDELQQEAAGIIAPRPLREAAQRMMTGHLGEFIADLNALQRDSMYVYNARKHVAKLIAQCGWTLPKDVTSDSFLAWRARQNKAAKTLNGYLDFANALLHWMQRQGRLVANPLAGVGRVQTQGKEKRRRRALTDDEMRRLIAVAGPRRLVYLMAVHTGLRRAELAALEWGDIHLDAPIAFAQVRASTTKNHKAAVVGLPAEVVEDLRKITPTAPSTRVFRRIPSMEVFKADLQAADIPYRDAQGRQVDFHALRHTLGTMLGRLGVAPRVAMEVMRHSDMRLTNRTYTDAKNLPTLAVVEMLPRFSAQLGQQAVATGTGGAVQIDSQIDAHLGVCLGRGQSRLVAESGNAESENTLVNTGESRPRAGEVVGCHEGGESWGTRIRT